VVAVEDRIDPRFEQVVSAGARAGLAAAFVYFLLFMMANLFESHDAAQLTAEAVVRFTIGWGLGVPFSWLAWRVRRLPMLLAVAYALLIGLAAGQLASADTTIPLLGYGIVLGLVWRYTVPVPIR
jgi:hypothetical protein